jgi:hypothetical protein
MHNQVLHNGTIVDGTGASSFTGKHPIYCTWKHRSIRVVQRSAGPSTYESVEINLSRGIGQDLRASFAPFRKKTSQSLVERLDQF